MTLPSPASPVARARVEAAAGRPIRVLVVDDSAVVRRMITDALSRDPAIEVVGTAIDPIIAQDKIRRLQPDVLTLDVEMPRMDGISFLRQIMRESPVPVILLSSLTQEGSRHALDALEAGAFDVLAKPGSSYTIGHLGPELAEKIKAAAAHGRRHLATASAPATAPAPVPPSPPAAAPSAPRPAARSLPPPKPALPTLGRSTDRAWDPRHLLLLGASTGGTEALSQVLSRLPANVPPIAIVQHIPAHFSRAFADRLNTLCAFEVREAVEGDALRPGLALVAPGNFHLLLRWAGDHYTASVRSGPPVWHQRPAVDVLFNSVAEFGGRHIVAAVLTGMGRDGAEGLLKLRQRGARTFAQDEATSVVFGMPRVAHELGGSERLVALPDLPGVLLSALEGGTDRGR